MFYIMGLLGPQMLSSSHLQLFQAVWFLKLTGKSWCSRERSAREVRKRESEGRAKKKVQNGWVRDGWEKPRLAEDEEEKESKVKTM